MAGGRRLGTLCRLHGVAMADMPRRLPPACVSSPRRRLSLCVLCLQVAGSTRSTAWPPPPPPVLTLGHARATTRLLLRPAAARPAGAGMSSMRRTATGATEAPAARVGPHWGTLTGGGAGAVATGAGATLTTSQHLLRDREQSGEADLARPRMCAAGSLANLLVVTQFRLDRGCLRRLLRMPRTGHVPSRLGRQLKMAVGPTVLATRLLRARPPLSTPAAACAARTALGRS